MFEKAKFQWQPLVELGLVLFTILGSTIPLYLHTDNKLEASLKEIRNEFSAQSAAQNARTDKLYEMWCATQKEIADAREESNRKWVETQKEIKDIYQHLSKERI